MAKDVLVSSLKKAIVAALPQGAINFKNVRTIDADLKSSRTIAFKGGYSQELTEEQKQAVKSVVKGVVVDHLGVAGIHYILESVYIDTRNMDKTFKGYTRITLDKK